MTTIRSKNPIMDFYKRLRLVDKSLTAAKIKKLQPDWWDDELISSPSAVQQLKISLARFFNFDLRSVLDDQAKLISKDFNCRYKHSVDKTPEQIKISTSILHGLAETVSMAVSREYQELPSPQEIRQNILDSGKKWVDLSSLIDLCWSNGIPVLYIPELPTSSKMDAVAIEVSGRPVIFLTKKAKHESWLLFHLAHELGHVIAGHLTDGTMLIDEKIDNSDTDEQEHEANNIAFELLIGVGDHKYGGRVRGVNSRQLALAAKTRGLKDNVDPGHIILNWGHTTNRFPVANGALNFLYPNPNWKALFIQNLLDNIDDDNVSEDSLEYLYKLINTDD
jgi:hypothetical protein